MRSHPVQSGETFDAPPTLERSGSEYRRAVTSFPLRARERLGEKGNRHTARSIFPLSDLL